MSWANITYTAGLCIVLATAVTAQPTLTVDLVGGGRSPTLTNNGLVWTISVDPDESRFDTPDSGENAGVRGATTAIDIGFDLGGGNPAVVANKNAANFGTEIPGQSFFGNETPDSLGDIVGVQIGSDPSNVFASLESAYFASDSLVDVSNSFEALTIETAPLSLAVPGVTNTVTITWRGAYDAGGSPGTTHGAVAQTGSFKDQIGVAGSAIYTATPGDADLVGSVSLDDFGQVLFNFGESRNWERGNFDGDELVDLDDFNTVLFNFGEPSGVLTFGGAAASIELLSTPEPSAWAIVVGAVLLAAGVKSRSGTRCIVRSRCC